MTNEQDIIHMDNPDAFCDHYFQHIKSNCNHTDNPDACWSRSKGTKDGYGHMSCTYYVPEDGVLKSKQRTSLSHRLMFIVYTRNLHLLIKYSPDQQVSHLCHNTRCCNPRHLVLEVVGCCWAVYVCIHIFQSYSAYHH